jgi:hypothetical protein
MAYTTNSVTRTNSGLVPANSVTQTNSGLVPANSVTQTFKAENEGALRRIRVIGARVRVAKR